MIEYIWKGFNIFKKKNFLKVFIVYLIFGIYTFFIPNYIFNMLSKVNLSASELIYLPELLINTLGIKSCLLTLLSFFGLILLSVILTITIANTDSKKISLKDLIKKSVQYSLLMSLVGLIFVLLMFVLISYMNVFTIILAIFFGIIGIILLFIFLMGGIVIGANNISIKEALKKTNSFLKRKKWSLILLLILLVLVNYLIFIVFDFLYFNLIFYNTTMAIITSELTFFINNLYSINALSLFVKEN